MDISLSPEHKRHLPLLVVTISVLVAYYCIVHELFYDCRQIVAGCVAIGSCLLAYGAYTFYQLSPDDVIYPYGELVEAFLWRCFLRVYGAFSSDRLLRDTLKCTKLQREFLLRTVWKNDNTRYGRKYGFKNLGSRDDFVSRVPLSTYTDVKPYVERIAEGKKGVLTIIPPRHMEMSSGATGQSKLIPQFQDSAWWFVSEYAAPLYSCVLKRFNQYHSLRKQLHLSYKGKSSHTSGGLYVRSPDHGGRYFQSLASTPAAARDLGSEYVEYYLHLLFALKDRELTSIEADNAAMVHSMFLYLESNWTKICQDLEFGCLDPDLPLAPVVRKKLDLLLRPDAARASEVRTELYQGFEGIAKRLWPKLDIIIAQDGGDMALHAQTLRNSYCKGIKLFSALYSSAETMIGLNVWPDSDCSEYLLLPRHVFYEFIPLDQSAVKAPRTLFTDQVEVGKTYEIVVTTNNGLVRYRLDDAVEVTRMFNETPVIRFKKRLVQTLDIASELTPGQAITDALCQTVTSWPDLHVTDHCCVVQRSKESKPEATNHYTVFIETKDSNTLPPLFSQQLDERLSSVHAAYGEKRRQNIVQPLQVRALRAGAFREFRTYRQKYVNNNANQFTVPRVLSPDDDVTFLIDHQV